MQSKGKDIDINTYALVGWVGTIMMGGILVHELILGFPGMPAMGFPGSPLAMAAAIILVFSTWILTSAKSLLIIRVKRVSVPTNEPEDRHEK
jgi:hypothetical protein